MNEVIERLNNYLSGYKSQYDYLDDNGLEHCLDDDIKQLLEIIKKLQQENQELKKQLEEWEQYLINAKEMLNLQGHDGNYNYDNYMLGLYNGMEYVIALFEKRNPIYKDGKDIKFLIDKNQQKEFIEYLENEKNRLAKECSHTYEDSLGRLLYVNEDIFNEVNRILLKYKEIIGGDNK